jgi:hypothetical protein
MSLLIMGLGITSVFTLFPMSVLRSVKSTNLTNATLVSQSARDLFYASRGTLTLPPSRSDSNIYTHGKDGYLTTSPVIPDNELASGVDGRFEGTYVIDPYGATLANGISSHPGKFGMVDPFTPNSGYGVFRVANGLSAGNVTSADSWITDYEEVPVSVDTSGANHTITFSDTGVADSVATDTRLLILSANLRQSITRGVDTAASSGGVIGLPASQGLPAAFDAADKIGLVRIQNFEPQRYTWLATIHQPRNGSPTGQLAVFFRRSAGEAEQLYDITSFQSNNFRIAVDDYTGGKPAVGDYIFGTWTVNTGGRVVRHGRWYRIQQVEDKGSDDYVITLDRRWVGRTQPANNPRVMFPRSVISVFDLPL